MRSEKLWDVYTARAGDRVYHGICETGMLKEREKRGWDWLSLEPRPAAEGFSAARGAWCGVVFEWE